MAKPASRHSRLPPNSALVAGSAEHQFLPVFSFPVDKRHDLPTMTALSRNATTVGLVCVTLAAISFNAAVPIISSPGLIATISALLLVFGLPHGSFDLALLRRGGPPGRSSHSRFALVLLYIGCAVLMYLVWRFGPVLALASFLILATAHFAEDWHDTGSGFMATGIAAAIVTAPVLLHREAVANLFVLLTGDSSAVALADVMLLLAPTAGAVALVGLVVTWQAGRQTLAVSAGCALAATLTLPPIPGFALFFCFVHSPLQFRHHADSLGLHGFKQWGPVVVPLSLGGLGVAAAVLVINGNSALATGVFASSFMTLSVLTVPHMLVPIFVRGRTHAHRLAPA
jgi:Brp/Blh family beta-carotene 15,15'-monooxygenase